MPKIMAQTYMQYVDSADYYITRELWEDAERVTIAALKLSPGNKLNKYLWSNLGEIRCSCENYDGSLQAFEIALASDKTNSDILSKRAYTYLKMGNQEKALEDLNSALLSDTILEWPLKMRGLILLGTGELDKAEKDFTNLKQHFPNNPEAYKGLGKILATKGDNKNAISMLRKSLELNQDEDTWFYLIVINIEDGNLNEAKEDLYIALKRYPRCGNLYLLRGVIHKLQYENDAALIDKKIAIDYGADKILIDKYFPKINGK